MNIRRITFAHHICNHNWKMYLIMATIPRSILSQATLGCWSWIWLNIGSIIAASQVLIYEQCNHNPVLQVCYHISFLIVFYASTSILCICNRAVFCWFCVGVCIISWQNIYVNNCWLIFMVILVYFQLNIMYAGYFFGWYITMMAIIRALFQINAQLLLNW